MAEPVALLQPSGYLEPVPRPWLKLYGKFLTSKGPHKQHEEDEEIPLALVQKLPDELSIYIMSFLNPYILGKAACVCRHWRGLVEHHRLWENPCLEAFQLTYPTKASLVNLANLNYKRSWKRMYLEHPHVRFDGLYVSRNTYVRTGATELRRERTVHVVVYYRYYRFFPDGTLLYCTSPHPVSKVAKSMSGSKASFLSGKTDPTAHVFHGQYVIQGNKVWSAIRYSNSWSTEIRCRMRLRSTVTGAHNRLDIEKLFSFDRELGVAQSVDGQGTGDGSTWEDVTADPPDGAGTRRDHSRGLSCCVFVPWDQVATSVLNLPASQMDFFCPG